jgi:hypothetical protein
LYFWWIELKRAAGERKEKKISSSISLFMKVTIHGTHCSISLAGNMLKKLGTHSQGK